MTHMANSDSGSPTNDHDQRWRGLKPAAKASLEIRDYSSEANGMQLATTGLEAGKVIALREDLVAEGAWIPGVEIFPRTIYQQRHRG